jgi:23S rRNA (pseudouridine1915-N3)-methyltransferase
MFRIDIVALGKNKDRWVDEAILHYITLLKKFASINVIYIPDIKGAKNFNELELRRAEAAAIEKRLHSGYPIALSDRGKVFNSVEFARFLSKLMMKSGSCEFIIGGIYGLDSSILEECRATLSLSPMTFSHQLVRPILLEQLYRAFSILSGGKYHK